MGGRGEWRGDPGTKQGGRAIMPPLPVPLFFQVAATLRARVDQRLITRTTRGMGISVRSLQRASPGLEEVKDLNEQVLICSLFIRDYSKAGDSRCQVKKA